MRTATVQLVQFPIQPDAVISIKLSFRSEEAVRVVVRSLDERRPILSTEVITELLKGYQQNGA